MRTKINKGQKENKLIKHNGKDEFGRLPGRYQIWRQHVSEMETWSPFRGQGLVGTYNFLCRSNSLEAEVQELEQIHITIIGIFSAAM
jgi:hypothetical protein